MLGWAVNSHPINVLHTDELVHTSGDGVDSLVRGVGHKCGRMLALLCE